MLVGVLHVARMNSTPCPGRPECRSWSVLIGVVEQDNHAISMREWHRWLGWTAPPAPAGASSGVSHTDPPSK